MLDINKFFTFGDKTRKKEKMPDIAVFTFDGNEIRTIIDEDGKPWFVADDIGAVLDIKNTMRILSNMVEGNTKTFLPIKERGKERPLRAIDESALDFFVELSTESKAKEFYHWVVNEIIPAINKRDELLAKNNLHNKVPTSTRKAERRIAMPHIVPFTFEEHRIRTITDNNGEPWFVARDVCAVLEIGDTWRAIEKLDKDEASQTRITDTIGRKQLTYIINESGLYTMIIRSDKPRAKQFRKWVTSEVLPLIRKTGAYAAHRTFKTPTKFSEALFLCAQKQAEIEANEHKVEAYDLFLTAENAQTMNEVAKSLNFGRNKLFALLREHGYLMKNNLPYQQYLDAGLFTVREITIERGDYVENKTQTLVTAKGVEKIKDLLYGNNREYYPVSAA